MFRVHKCIFLYGGWKVTSGLFLECCAPFDLFFWDWISHWPDACYGNLNIPRSSSPQHWDNNCVPYTQFFFFFAWAPVIELKLSDLYSKHFIECAVDVAPQNSILMFWSDYPVLVCHGCKLRDAKRKREAIPTTNLCILTQTRYIVPLISSIHEIRFDTCKKKTSTYDD